VGEHHSGRTLKKGGTILVSRINYVIILIWKTQAIFEEWRIATVCPIFKKGNPTNADNHRGISLPDSCYKIMTSFRLEGFNPYIEEDVDQRDLTIIM